MAGNQRIIKPGDGFTDRIDLRATQIGVVKDNTDAQNMGRLQVWIVGSTSLESDPNGWITCNYSSPFAGASNPDFLGNNIKDPDSTQTSYGFWAIPPDLNNQVLITFVNADIRRAYWTGCVYQKDMNYMVPGIAGGASFQGSEYPSGVSVPVSEYNKLTNAGKISQRPEFTSLAEGLNTQGLLTDNLRGAGTSSARRESPSQVFGFLTPGGNQFVMDDGDGSELIRIRTASGAQILISETDGHIYMISRDGKNWFELNNDGNVDCYSATGINMNTAGDFNIRAEGNVNIEGGGDVNIKGISAVNIQAQTDSINLNANNEINAQTLTNDISIKSKNNVNIQADTSNVNIKAQVDTDIQSVTNNVNIQGQNQTNIKSVSGSLGVSSGANYDLAVAANLNQTVHGTIASWHADGESNISDDFTHPSVIDDNPPEQPASPTSPTDAFLAATPTLYQQSLRNSDGDEEPIKSICDRIPDAEPWPNHAAPNGPSVQRYSVTAVPSDASIGSVVANASAPLPVVGSPSTGMPAGVYQGDGYDSKGSPKYSFSGTTSGLQPVNTLVTSPEGIQFIQSHEGPFQASPYPDATGRSIGWGHFIKPTDPAIVQTGPISIEIGNELLKADLKTSEDAVRKYITVPLTQAQFDALVDFTYNVGPGGLQISNLRTQLNQGNYAQVPNLMTHFQSAIVKNVRVNNYPPLVARRRDEGLLFSTPTDVSVA